MKADMRDNRAKMTNAKRNPSAKMGSKPIGRTKPGRARTRMGAGTPVEEGSATQPGGRMKPKAYAKGGKACGTKKYAKGGKVKGAGMCKKGVRPAKMA